jgi:hypothetical protein
LAYSGIVAYTADVPRKAKSSKPGPKPDNRSFTAQLNLRINPKMLAELRKMGEPSTSARLALIQWMLDKKMIRTSDLPE